MKIIDNKVVMNDGMSRQERSFVNVLLRTNKLLDGAISTMNSARDPEGENFSGMKSKIKRQVKIVQDMILDMADEVEDSDE